MKRVQEKEERLSVKIDDRLKEDFAKVCQRQNISMSEKTRELITNYIEGRRERKRVAQRKWKEEAKAREARILRAVEEMTERMIEERLRNAN